jgi:hypothetical protein
MVSSGLALALAQEQERPVPSNSERLSIPGCAYDRLFIVDVNPEHETRGIDLKPGRRLRLQGPRQLLAEINARKRGMVEITGLMRKSDLVEDGVSLAGGKVRVTGRSPVGGNGVRDPGVSQAVIDVESWRLLNFTCPER